MALNGPDFKFSQAISFLVNCDTQEEVDDLWNRLSEGGKELQCGWLIDKFGVSWQVCPSVLVEMIQDKDAMKSERVMAAMLQMTKLNIQRLRMAYERR
jgi:predicted 3-demethylubiquinone-9 3-methyltransferase (glyoxalase superfamily)